jgi:hypothetical protein
VPEDLVMIAGLESFAVATLNDILRGVSYTFVALAGAAGMGREVRRVVHVREAEDLVVPVGSGDLVVYAAPSLARSQRQDGEHVLTSLLASGVVAVLTNAEPSGAALQAAERAAAPLVVALGGVDTEELHALLLRSLELGESVIHRERGELQREFSNLVRAGGSTAMLLQRLVEISGKAVALHGQHLRVEHCLHAVLQQLDQETFSRVIDASDAEVQRWLVDKADSAVNNVLYLELGAEHMVRLFTPVWIEGQFAGGVSLVGRPDQMSARDRAALLAAVRAMTGVIGGKAVDIPKGVAARRCLVLALRAPAASLDELTEVAQRVLGQYEPLLLVGREHVSAALVDDGCEPWERRRRLAAWRAAMTSEVGVISIGHAVYRGRTSAEFQRAMVCAAEAALMGDHLYGPGHVTSYADAQLATFFWSGRGTHELRTLYERVIGRLAQEDPKRERGLVETLDVYCEAVSTVSTAERLQVHRNTVLYRLKHIQEATSLDINDGASRLLLQLGLVAGRFAGEARRHVPTSDVPHSIAHLLGVAPGVRHPYPGTA